MENQKGSVLVITIVAVLILSIMVTGLLTVGTTELYTTQNYQLNRTAYYTAVQGVEEIRNIIYNTPDASSVTNIVKSTYQTEQYEAGGMKRSYITGTLKDREAGGTYGIGVPITRFEGFKAPTFPGISLGGGTSIAPVVWKVYITGEVTVGEKNKKTAYAEVSAGIYSVLTTGY